MKKNQEYRELISKLYSKLGRKKKAIADVLLNHPGQILDKNASELAKQCGCDQATVVRFAQQLGYDGYSSLKLAIARETDIPWRNGAAEPGKQNRFNLSCEKLLQLHIDALKTTLGNQSEGVFDELSEKISGAKKVMICGAGTSNLAAQDLNVKLMRQGINSSCFADPQMWKTFIGYLDENDLLIVFSHSGETPEIIELAGLAREKGIFLVAITGFAGSPLAQMSDSVLLTDCRNERSLRLGAMTSRASQSIIVDLIAIQLSMRDKQQAWDFLEKSYYGFSK